MPVTSSQLVDNPALLSLPTLTVISMMLVADVPGLSDETSWAVASEPLSATH